MKTLVIITSYGNKYLVNEKKQIIRNDMKFTPSDGWLFLGLSHVKHNEFIPFESLTPEKIKSMNLLWKNGNPQFTVRDLDHGTVREWGNTKYHGVKRIYFE